ncbi:MAG: hypothetical protein LBF81_04940, partial [Prevotellaceae bacterium]|nr:hypothetical protein [Prevotellaceae bacterium]
APARPPESVEVESVQTKITGKTQEIRLASFFVSAGFARKFYSLFTSNLQIQFLFVLLPKTFIISFLHGKFRQRKN